MSYLKRNLRFYLKNNYNVLLCGKHGVGKTTIVKELFEEEGLKWMYFSASTMDPWVDFIGVPKERTDERGSYLDLVLPKKIRDDNVDAIFFDEFNRGKSKVRNAVLEFIQFKEINGRKFKNLKVIWAAINPDDDEEQEYNVEKLDPAEKDRFHAQIEVPYRLDKEYFVGKYGSTKADAAIEWWNALPKEAKNLTSPRRVDYALEIYNLNGDVKDVLHPSANVSKFISALASGPVKNIINDLYDKGSDQEIAEFFKVPNNYSSSLDIVIKSDNFINKFIPLWPDEKIVSVMAVNRKVFDFVINKYLEIEKFKDILDSITSSDSNKKLSARIRKAIGVGGNINFNDFIKTVKNSNLSNTHHRRKYFEFIKKYIKKIAESAYAEQRECALNTSCHKLIDIANSSHYNSIKIYYPDIFSLINYCFFTIRKNGFVVSDALKKDAEELMQKHPIAKTKVAV